MRLRVRWAQSSGRPAHRIAGFHVKIYTCINVLYICLETRLHAAFKEVFMSKLWSIMSVRVFIEHVLLLQISR